MVWTWFTCGVGGLGMIGFSKRWLLAAVVLALGACDADDGSKRTRECKKDADCAKQVEGQCITATCVNKRCKFEERPDGTVCDDGEEMTREDACNAGECVGAPMVRECTDEPGPCEEKQTDPVTGDCSIVPKPNGTACDDGDLCTQIDECSQGLCAGTQPVSCSAMDDCHSPGTCDPATGECSNPEKPDGTACDDGSVCTDSDQCIGGGCLGTPVVCDDGLFCSFDTCDPTMGGCVSDTSTCACQTDNDCDDGNPCTGVETCDTSTNLCQNGTPVSCSSLNDQCNQGTCNPASGQCEATPVMNGSACDDGDLCTTGDACQSGACTGGSPVVCTPLSDCHDAGVCDPGTGACSNPQKSDGSVCTDGDSCTQTDECQSGACVGSNPIICSPSDQCHSTGTCDPSTGACTDPPVINGTPCDDADLCTQADTCQDGACVGASPVQCTALDGCHLVGVCDPGTGVCSNPEAPDGSSCSDGFLCTTGDQCTSGSCGGSAVVCDDGIACSIDSCSEALGGCTFDTSPCPCTTSTDCDDGNPCNGVETCNISNNTCQSGTPVDCSHLDDACNSGACNPSTGSCQAVPRADGTSCDDGDLCTQTDSCQSGTCVGANPVVCTALDQCHDPGVCNPSTGACSNPNKADGSACDDGNLCTQSDTCQAGSCVGANPVTCSASDQCHDPGTCNPATGVCTDPPKPNGSSCDDGDACTQTDTCQGGVCSGGNPLVCVPLDQCHVAGTCNPATGVCTDPAKPDGSSCNDGDLCTQTDECQAGICTGSNPVVCAPMDQCHDAGTCDPATGVCDDPAKPNGSSCSDGNACTQTDTCQGGLCTGSNPVICMPLDQCHVAGTCDPATGSCSDPEAPGGTPCNDGDLCTQTDTCQSGVCTGTNPVVCVPLDQCHVAGTCNPATGVCSNPNAANGTSCNDGLVCTDPDTCTDGVCGGSSITCDDMIACTVDTCVEPTGCNFDTSGCACTGDPDCDDGNPCNGVETCNLGNFTCQSGTPTDCSSLDDQCNIGVCNSSTGACEAQPRPNGTGCDDGNLCTQTDQCQSGACVGSNPVVCNPLDQCHDAGTCNPATGVCDDPAKPNGTGCNDGDLCTQTDTCQGGVCTGSNPVVCVPLDQCHNAGTCNPATGVCDDPTKPDGSGCDDGDACTQTDECQSGVCTGSNPVVCVPLDQCHNAGTCDPATGVCDDPAKPNGSGCNDGDLCTQTDTCQNGVCTGSNPVVCVPLDQCHNAGTCDPATGVCDDPAKPDGSSCNDGDLCTQTDECQAGVCTGTDPVTCLPLSQCHIAGVCIPSTGICTNPPASSGTSCDDGDACTDPDTCDGSGTCVGGSPVTCPPPSGQCKVSLCDSVLGCIENDKPNGTSCDDGTECTQIDQCFSGVCTGTDPRRNANADWTDDPGGDKAGPDSIDVFSSSDGELGTVGSYRGTVFFDNGNPVSLGLPGQCNDGLYLAVYKEFSGSISHLVNIGCERSAVVPGDFTVTHAAVHPDDTFTVIGTFVGTADFGQPGNVITRVAASTQLFFARYDRMGNIIWVARAIPGGSATNDSVTTLDDRGAVAIGTNDENLVFHDAADIPRFTVPGGGVWAAHYKEDGSLPYARRVVQPSTGNFISARAVTGQEDARWTLTGDFQGTYLFGPGGERSMSSQRGGVDTWVLDLRPDGSFNWAARVGADGNDRSGDVTRLNGGAAMLSVDTQGKTPSADDAFQTLLLRSITSSQVQTHVLRFEPDGKLTRAAILGDTDGKVRGWQVGLDAAGFVTLAGTFSEPIALYGDVGFGGGAPPGSPAFTLGGNGGPDTLFVSRLDEGCRFFWAIQAGGDGSGMTTKAGWDIVQTDHPSRSISLGGMFDTDAVFGDQVPELLTPGDRTGSPFVVHLNSEAEYDYCP